MNLQNIFYLVGIIYMILFILMTAAIVVLLFYIKNTISDIHRSIDEKIDLITEKATKPLDIATDVGNTIAGAIMDTAKKFGQKRGAISAQS